MTAVDVARGLQVAAPQMQQWLDLLVKDGALEKTKRPVRYSVRQFSLFEAEGETDSTAAADTARSG
jgi:hypothetical protein